MVGQERLAARSGHMRYEIIATTPSPLPWERGYGIPGVFFILAIMGGIAILGLARINPTHINYVAVRGLDLSGSHEGGRWLPSAAKGLFSDKALPAVALPLFFFHLGSAALLPLLGQSAVYCGGPHLGAGDHDPMRAVGSAHGTERRYGLLFLAAMIDLPYRCGSGRLRRRSDI